MTVITPGGTSGPESYTYDPVPTLSTVTPTAGKAAGGTVVTLTGTGFRTGATAVTFGAGKHGTTVHVTGDNHPDRHDAQPRGRHRDSDRHYPRRDVGDQHYTDHALRLWPRFLRRPAALGRDRGHAHGHRVRHRRHRGQVRDDNSAELDGDNSHNDRGRDPGPWTWHRHSDRQHPRRDLERECPTPTTRSRPSPR